MVDTSNVGSIAERVRRDPRFAELERARWTFSVRLTIAMLVIYFCFILLVAFQPQLLAIPLAAGSVMTLGFPVGVGVILSAIVLTGIYVARANNEFDRITAQIVEAVQ